VVLFTDPLLRSMYPLNSFNAKLALRTIV